MQAMPHELEEIIVPGEGMAKQEDLPDIVKPLNDYNVEEKLDIALTMAESIADLHGFKDGVMYVIVLYCSVSQMCLLYDPV